MQEREDIQSHKVMGLDADKRDRIINAAMREFMHGFKRASTDNIVREAGISKGLLFHYFGTKENLYSFLITYGCDLMVNEYFNLVNVRQPDLFESFWQMMLLKRDLMQRYPLLFNFLAQVFFRQKEGEEDENALLIKGLQEKMMGEIFGSYDASMFKEDIDPRKAANIALWTLTGYAEGQLSPDKTMEDYQQEYGRYLTELKEYFDILRRVLYKPQEGLA